MLGRCAVLKPPPGLRLCSRAVIVHSRRHVRMTASAAAGQTDDLDAGVEAVVRGLHSNGTKAVCYVTGGASQVRMYPQLHAQMAGRPGGGADGAACILLHCCTECQLDVSSVPPWHLPPARQAVAWLLGVPGASNTILEVSVPYCRDSLVDILGQVIMSLNHLH
jgi:hypothetical protein